MTGVDRTRQDGDSETVACVQCGAAHFAASPGVQGGDDEARDELARIYLVIDTECQDAPAPNHAETDFNAGYIAGLTFAQSTIRTPAQRRVSASLATSPGVQVGDDEARDRLAAAWDEGYSAAQLDALECPYSDMPEAATWVRRQSPYRAAGGGGQ